MKPAGLVAAAVVIAAIAFTAGRLTTPENHSASPRVYKGWATMPIAMTAIACCGDDEDHAGGRSYLTKVGHWRDLRGDDNSWHEGDEPAPCFNDTGTPFHARIGVVEVKPGDAVGTDLVAWLECL